MDKSYPHSYSQFIHNLIELSTIFKIARKSGTPPISPLPYAKRFETRFDKLPFIRIYNVNLCVIN